MTINNSIDAQQNGFQSLDTSTGTWNGRTLQQGTNITITNPDGVAGDPTISATGGGVETIDGDTGSITGSTVTIFANKAANHCGATVLFSNSGTTSTLSVSSNGRTFIGLNAGSLTGTSTNATGIGRGALGAETTCNESTAVGRLALQNATASTDSTAVGNASLGQVILGTNSTAVGSSSGNGPDATWGLYIGSQSGQHHTGTESNNIIIDSLGVTGDNTIIRIGDFPASSLPYTQCYVGGIVGASPSSNPVPLMVDSVTGQLTPGSVSGSPFTAINVQTFTTSGTYTPTTNMSYCTIECWGGGGGGGGAQQNGVTFTGGAGGGAGGYSRVTAISGAVLPSQTVTIGAAGAASPLGASPGGNGGITSVGSLCIANGGTGGDGANPGANSNGGAGGTPGTGDIAAYGMNGDNGYSTATTATITAIPGNGGSTLVGAGGLGAQSPNTSGGGALGFGSGAGGAQAQTIQQSGGAGAPGYVIITEYIS
jgi:hypothetical protein